MIEVDEGSVLAQNSLEVSPYYFAPELQPEWLSDKLYAAGQITAEEAGVRLESTHELVVGTRVSDGWLLDLGVVPIGNQIHVSGLDMEKIVLQEVDWPNKQYVEMDVNGEESVERAKSHCCSPKVVPQKGPSLRGTHRFAACR